MLDAQRMATDQAIRVEGRRRVVVEALQPAVDGGAFPAKRIAGDEVRVEADIFTDGHDRVAALLLHRREGESEWQETPMAPLGNDRWASSFVASAVGRYWFTVEGWSDAFATWRHDLRKRLDAQQDVTPDLPVGARLVEAAADRADGADRERLLVWARELAAEDRLLAERCAFAFEADLQAMMDRHPDRSHSTRFGQELAVEASPERARASAWYEFFPRSCSPDASRHGNLVDTQARLRHVAAMGFDVVYLPPIHPIGRTFRKGRNNSPTAANGDVGSPWAIGAREGGHKEIHSRLGTLEDFDRFVAAAKGHGLEVAMDLAYQCSPDHPYVKRHPEWFRHRPDGTIQYAENPPKKYQDIYPFDFETEAWPELWRELKSVVDFWIGHGVRRFRVDNPHTKPFRFWQWLIAEVRKEHPDVLFLAEAFTRPKVMYRLAKLGFDHSYTYFAWRNSKWEITQYFSELYEKAPREFFRPHLWPNTPDILTEHLQAGGRPAFIARFVLAATLAPNYGIYGPAFELMEHEPVAPGSEEYVHAEKYEIKHWDWDRADTLRPLITHVNKIRHENPALRWDTGFKFHGTDNEQLLCYSRRTPDRSNVLLIVVNMDPRRSHVGSTDLDLAELGLPEEEPFQVHDLLTDGRYVWRGRRNYIEVRPHEMPAHIFRIRRKLHSEQDFDYFL